MSLTSFSNLPPPTLATTSPPSSPRRRTPRSWVRKVERCCCGTLAYFPLLFVHGLTTWAVWAEVRASFVGSIYWLSYVEAGLGIGLWALANACYSVAVFTSPGSPLDRREDWGRARPGGGRRKGATYEGLPTDEVEDDDREGGMTTVTAKTSTGKPRYCKKCHTIKPDRAHHCSTCGRCVLKMDHHCPWLATCVGLRNYKAFVLFLAYTSAFCWVCFGVSASWVWEEIMDESPMTEGVLVINTILLAVLGGIIGLVLSGFTGWHIYLALTNQTTIESLEKTRYLSPLRKAADANSHRNYLSNPPEHPGEEQTLVDRMKELHANALPGVLRPEEGEQSQSTSRAGTPAVPQTALQPPIDGSSPARDSLQRSFAHLEAQREQERYEAYLDEQDSEKLPNAFDLGWKRNFRHVFGRYPGLWWLPVCNTGGDGWLWDINPKWTEARDGVAQERMRRGGEEAAWNANGGGQPAGFEPPPQRRDLRWTPGLGFVDSGRKFAPRMNSGAGHHRSRSSDTDIHMQMQPLDRRRPPAANIDNTESDESSSDDEVMRMYSHPQIQGLGNWNDVPDEFLAPRNDGGTRRSKSRDRRKGD